jgi:hypothetical protein
MNILITLGVFLFLVWFSYIGAKGRIEGKNQYTGEKQDLGPLSADDYLALKNGTYKRRAFIQALFSSSVLSIIFYLLLNWLN